MFTRKQLQGKLSEAELDAMQNEIKTNYALALLSRIDDELFPDEASMQPLLAEHFKQKALRKE